MKTCRNDKYKGECIVKYCLLIVALIAFVGCGSQKISYEYTEVSDGYAIRLPLNTTIRLTGDVVIPSEYNGKPVTEIKLSGFASQSNMSSVTIPASVKRIGLAAFVLATTNIIFKSVNPPSCDWPVFKTRLSIKVPSGSKARYIGWLSEYTGLRKKMLRK